MKTEHTKPLLAYLIATTLLAGATVPAFASTQEVRISATGFIDASQDEAASTNLKQIMSGVASARADLKNKQPAQAEQDLSQSQAALKNVTDRYGPGTASVYISSEHKALNLDDEDALEAEPDMHSLIQLDNAKTALTEGQFEAAAKMVDSVDYPLAFASIDIPLSQTQAGIDTAVSLIKAGKTDKAEQALKQIQALPLTSSGIFASDFTTH